MSFLFLVLISCKSQKLQLENNSILSLKEGYYIDIPPAIKEGNTYLKTTIVFNDFNKEEIELVGFYFRNNYVLMKDVSNPFAIEGSILKGKNKSTSRKNIPFDLKPFEVVVSYIERGKLKHIKIKVKRKVSFDDVPR